MPEQEPILNIDEVSRYLRVPKSTVYKLVREHQMPGHKVGKHWRFSREAIARWLDESPQPLCSGGARRETL